MRTALLFVTLVLTSCGTPTDDPMTDAGGPGDPCDQVSMFTCNSSETCDEVYSSEAADYLEGLCDGPDDESLVGQCPFTQCCYAMDGLGGRPSLHCVSSTVDPNYRAYCEGRGNVYCPR